MAQWAAGSSGHPGGGIIGLRREWHKKEREAEFWQWSQQPENRGKILQSLLTPEQHEEEIERRKAETQRKMKEALGIQ